MINLISLDPNGINSPFGERNTGIKGASTNHKGIDITLANDNVPSVLGGTVLSKGTSASAGNWISIQQTDGTKATYMHLAKLPGLSAGDSVAMGDTIGVQGSTGISSGKHLHFQVETSDGVFIDPEKYFATGDAVDYLNSDRISGGFSADSNDSFIGKIVRFIVILLLCVLSAFLFLKAFDISII